MGRDPEYLLLKLYRGHAILALRETEIAEELPKRVRIYKYISKVHF